jgi:hypothetical protein
MRNWRTGEKDIMNANDVIVDLLEDNRRRVHRVFSAMSDECIYWKPDAETNNIEVTVWHMARIIDVFLTQQAIGDSEEEECWFRNGWAERTGYDPRGIGQNGWGMLAGFTQEEVTEIPKLKREQMLTHLNEVYDKVGAYISNTPMEKLQIPSSGFDGRYSRYQCVQMALLDNVRHLGEIYALKARWDREIKHRGIGIEKVN